MSGVGLLHTPPRPATRPTASPPAAHSPPEWRGVARDGVRLLVSDDAGHRHATFLDLADHLDPVDLLVVNESATLPASLPARGRLGEFRLNLSTRYADDLWLAEPRWSVEQPGPMPWRPGDRLLVAGVAARMVAPLTTAPRLWFVAFDGDPWQAMRQRGVPIRYGYLAGADPPLSAYQTIFARVPGSAEMPSAGRPFTARVLGRLRARGVRIARVVLHAGVSSLDLLDGSTASVAFPEPFRVPGAAAHAINRTRRDGGRIVAVGTTVVRALESAADGGETRPTSGFTRVLIGPERGAGIVDGLVTGFHTEGTSHLALLTAIGGAARVGDAYGEALREGYLWHEFGDVHLLWKPGRAPE